MAFKYMRDLMLRSRFTCRIHRAKEEEKKPREFPDLTNIFDIGNNSNQMRYLLVVLRFWQGIAGVETLK